MNMAAYNSYGQEENYGAPHRNPQFDTMNLEAPMRMQETPRPAVGGEALSAGYVPAGPAMTEPQAAVPARPTAALHMEAAGGARRMARALVISSLILRVGALLSLIVAVVVLASDSHSLPNYGRSVSISNFSATKYALAAAIIGVIYLIYETVSIAVRLGRGHLLLPGKASLFVSYIGDQIVIVLLLTGASAGIATLKDLHDLNVVNDYGYNVGSFCDNLGSFCNQGAGAMAMLFLGFCFLAASLAISSFCFYKNRI